MARGKVKATKLSVTLPFGVGQLDLEVDDAQQRAAWDLYVEVATRVVSAPIDCENALIRETLSSLHSLFGATRRVLCQAGPCVARRPKSLGPIAIRVLNGGLRPFVTKWHSLLLSYEQKRAPDRSLCDHERNWDRAAEFWCAFQELQDEMAVYSTALAVMAEVTPAD